MRGIKAKAWDEQGAGWQKARDENALATWLAELLFFNVWVRYAGDPEKKIVGG